MSAAEFETLVALFLEGNASAEQVARLRAAMSASPALRVRFQASARLHQAQLACLSRREERSSAGVMSWLHAYGQRMGRSFAHLCLLALVFGLLSPLATQAMLGTPPAFIATLAGLAMLRVLQTAFTTAFGAGYPLGATVTFLVTVTDLAIFNIGAAFWGLVAGAAVGWLLERPRGTDGR